MLASTRNTGGEKTGRPRRLRGFARVALVLGWVVFWLNTAFFPCCETIAAALGGHAGNVSQSVSAVQPAHHPDDTHSGPPVHSPDPPCAYSLSAGPTIVGDYEVLTSDRSPQEWFAVDTPVVTSLTAVNHSANLALARAAPPPSLRLYLRTRRLLI